MVSSEIYLLHGIKENKKQRISKQQNIIFVQRNKDTPRGVHLRKDVCPFFILQRRAHEEHRENARDIQKHFDCYRE